jgi:DNA-binding response OmpR family regulator
LNCGGRALAVEGKDFLVPLIVCAEDNPETAKVVRFFVQNMRDTRVVMCRDGGEALDVLAADTPDVVVLDAMMPCVDGMTVLRTMRGEARLAGVPVIFLTSETSAAFHADCMESGANAVLTKPFNPSMLVDEIRRQLGAGPRAAPADS